MNAVAVGMAAGSVVMVMGTVVTYLRTIPRNKVPVSVTPLIAKLWLGIGLSAAAVIWAYQTASLGAAVIAPAAFAAMMGMMILWVVGQRKVPAGDLQVELGSKLLPFEAQTAEGERFHSDELAGQRTLLKFFRGGW
jgi:drug/metabolite transporter (DMT)-like permease